MNLDKDVIEIPNWIDLVEIQSLKKIVSAWTPEPSIPPAGFFAGQLVSLQHYHAWNKKDEIAQILQPRLETLFGDFLVVECVYQELHLPWDIHCDLHRKGVLDPSPWRSVLIPLESSNSVTVIFKETSEWNDFWQYKQNMLRSEQPITEDLWQQHLDFCWAEDREWLTLDHISRPWQAGTMLSFPRNRLHSSDNFHKRTTDPKKFIQILLDKIKTL